MKEGLPPLCRWSTKNSYNTLMYTPEYMEELQHLSQSNMPEN